MTAHAAAAAHPGAGRGGRGGGSTASGGKDALTPDELWPAAGLMLCAEVPAPANAAAPTTAPASQPAQVFKDKDGKIYPPFDKLADMPGDAKAGALVFRNPNVGCIRCHQIGDEGGMVGPPLGGIGEKYTKPQLVEAIFFPSAGIAMGYENWIVRTKDGDVQAGIKVEDTEDHVTLKDNVGQYHDIPADDVVSKKMDTQSIMPEGLNAAMTRQDMVNLVEYLATLKSQ